MNWLVYEHYAYAAVAAFGTLAAVWFSHRLARMPATAAWRASYAGVAPPFINVNAMLFGLTLAFIATDTWSARDRAMDAVYSEADAIRSLLVLAEVPPEPLRRQMDAAIRAYGQAAVEEFEALRGRSVNETTNQSADALLRLVATPSVEAASGAAVHAEMLRQVMALRDDRDLRVSLSRTHLNPLKWLGMASLGFLTILSIGAVHLDKPRAGTLAIALFALAAAPSAAVVLVQGNPFQPPAAISPEPIIEALRL